MICGKIIFFVLERLEYFNMDDTDAEKMFILYFVFIPLQKTHKHTHTHTLYLSHFIRRLANLSLW